MKKTLFLIAFFVSTIAMAQKPADLVNPFIGTTNFGTTNPGAVTPNGMMSVVPFNVMGSDLNVFDKDNRWWSAPYEYNNKFFTGYAHVALSGVGCPEASSLLVMPRRSRSPSEPYFLTSTKNRSHAQSQDLTS